MQLVYHLPRSQRHPNGLEVKVPRSFDEFLDILIDKFPHEEEGIRGFYGECWTVRACWWCWARYQQTGKLLNSLSVFVRFSATGTSRLPCVLKWHGATLQTGRALC